MSISREIKSLFSLSQSNIYFDQCTHIWLELSISVVIALCVKQLSRHTEWKTKMNYDDIQTVNICERAESNSMSSCLINCMTQRCTTFPHLSILLARSLSSHNTWTIYPAKYFIGIYNKFDVGVVEMRKYVESAPTTLYFSSQHFYLAATATVNAIHIRWPEPPENFTFVYFIHKYAATYLIPDTMICECLDHFDKLWWFQSF